MILVPENKIPIILLLETTVSTTDDFYAHTRHTKSQSPNSRRVQTAKNAARA